MQRTQNPMEEMQKIFGNSPEWQQFKQLTHGKNEKELEQVARNLAKTKGIDINQFAMQNGLRI